MIIIALSGGVDSAVAALLLKKKGIPVEALFMKNWEEDDNDEHCSARVDLRDCQSLCQSLNIPLHTINFASEYWDNVFTHFLQEYRKGRTPNPDVACNKEIKFKIFLEHAICLGAEKIATGHYAALRHQNGEYQLHKAHDLSKDQSYFLYTLQQHQLDKTLFPLAEIDKKAVRLMAEKEKLCNYEKKDSTGICFIGERNFTQFLQQYIPAQPGDIIDPENNLIGQHQGLMYYTLGQRQGLAIGGSKQGNGQPWFVAKKNLKTNQLIAVQGHAHPMLLQSHCVVSDLTWVGTPPLKKMSCTCKTRYRQADQKCVVELLKNKQAKVIFEQPQRAVTPGQSIVFYQQSRCFGGGIID